MTVSSKTDPWAGSPPYSRGSESSLRTPSNRVAPQPLPQPPPEPYLPPPPPQGATMPYPAPPPGPLDVTNLPYNPPPPQPALFVPRSPMSAGRLPPAPFQPLPMVEIEQGPALPPPPGAMIPPPPVPWQMPPRQALQPPQYPPPYPRSPARRTPPPVAMPPPPNAPLPPPPAPPPAPPLAPPSPSSPFARPQASGHRGSESAVREEARVPAGSGGRMGSGSRRLMRGRSHSWSSLSPTARAVVAQAGAVGEGVEEEGVPMRTEGGATGAEGMEEAVGPARLAPLRVQRSQAEVATSSETEEPERPGSSSASGAGVGGGVGGSSKRRRSLLLLDVPHSPLAPRVPSGRLPPGTSPARSAGGALLPPAGVWSEPSRRLPGEGDSDASPHHASSPARSTGTSMGVGLAALHAAGHAVGTVSPYRPGSPLISGTASPRRGPTLHRPLHQQPHPHHHAHGLQEAHDPVSLLGRASSTSARSVASIEASEAPLRQEPSNSPGRAAASAQPQRHHAFDRDVSVRGIRHQLQQGQVTFSEVSPFHGNDGAGPSGPGPVAEASNQLAGEPSDPRVARKQRVSRVREARRVPEAPLADRPIPGYVPGVRQDAAGSYDAGADGGGIGKRRSVTSDGGLAAWLHPPPGSQRWLAQRKGLRNRGQSYDGAARLHGDMGGAGGGGFGFTSRGGLRRAGGQPVSLERSSFCAAHGWLVAEAVGPTDESVAKRMRRRHLLANVLSLLRLLLLAGVLGYGAAHVEGGSLPQCVVVLVLQVAWVGYTVGVRPFASWLVWGLEVCISLGEVVLVAMALAKQAGASFSPTPVAVAIAALFACAFVVVALEAVRAVVVLLFVIGVVPGPEEALEQEGGKGGRVMPYA